MSFPHWKRGFAAVCAAAVMAALLAVVAAPADARNALPAKLDRKYENVGVRVTGSGRIRVSAAAAYCKGFPKMNIWVNGKLDRTLFLKSRKAKNYYTKKTYRAGTHRVTVVMRGDWKVRGKRGRVVCDRNVRVMRVTPAVASPAKPLVTSPAPSTAPTTTPTTAPTTSPTTTPTVGPPAPTTPAPAPPEAGDGDGAFTVGVIGDTQAEVFDATGGRFAKKTQWLIDNAASQDLRFVAHTGDVVNWGWLQLRQYEIAQEAMRRLTKAKIPWQATIGNHDTRAVGEGGGAYTGVNSGADCRAKLGDAACKTADLLRATQEFNQYFTAADFGAVRGAFEPGKVDNVFSTFEAEGHKFLVLSLEYYPRAAVVKWADAVLTQYADSNVIIQTHHYLDGGGNVGGGGTGGDSTAPTALRDQLIAKHSNVKVVLSGHTGLQNTSVEALGSDKHRVVAFLGNENKANAVVRLIQFDVKSGTISSRYWYLTTDAERNANVVPFTQQPKGTTLASGIDFK